MHYSSQRFSAFLLLRCGRGFSLSLLLNLLHWSSPSPLQSLFLEVLCEIFPCRGCVLQCTNLQVCFCFCQAEAVPESGRDVGSAQSSSGQHGSEPAGGTASSQSSAGTSAAASFFIRYCLFLLVSITAPGSSNSWETLFSVCHGAGGWSWSPGHECGFLLPLESKGGMGTPCFSLWNLYWPKPKKTCLGLCLVLNGQLTTSLLFCRFPWSKSWSNKSFPSDLD